MPKIGMMTFYESDNYGTCLQAWSLQHTIQRLGYECEVLNFSRSIVSNKKSSKRSVLKNIGIMTTAELILLSSRRKSRKQAFRVFRDTITISPKAYGSLEDLKGTVNQYNAFVVGSDMVWSWESQIHLDKYFLKFAPAGRRVAYAPSFGNTVLTGEMEAYYRDALLGMDYLSCRERSGKELIEQLTGKNCELVLDPTMLLTADEWQETFQLGKFAPKKKQGRTILCSLFDRSSRKACIRQIKKAMKQGDQLRHIPSTFEEYLTEALAGAQDKAYGPVEFLKAYYNADMIISDGFHGLVFSLIFQKPFLLIHRSSGEHWAKHEERMASLLEELGLSSRYIKADVPISPEHFTLDYTQINQKIAHLRESSLKYLEDALAGAVK